MCEDGVHQCAEAPHEHGSRDSSRLKTESYQLGVAHFFVATQKQKIVL